MGGSGAKKANKRAAAAASGSKRSWVREHVGLIVVAVGLQLFLTIGYVSWPAPAPDPASERARQSVAETRSAASLSDPGPAEPGVCVVGWAECPQIDGVDWPALFARAQAPDVWPSEEALKSCDAAGLLSPHLSLIHI